MDSPVSCDPRLTIIVNRYGVKVFVVLVCKAQIMAVARPKQIVVIRAYIPAVSVERLDCADERRAHANGDGRDAITDGQRHVSGM